MTQGDGQDHSTGQGLPDDQAPVPSGNSEVTVEHPFADNQFDFVEFIERLKLAGIRFKNSRLLHIFIGLAIFWAIWASLFGALDVLASVSPSAIAAILWLVGCLAGLVQWALTPIFILAFIGLQLLLYKPMAELLFDGSAQLAKPLELVKSEIGKVFKGLLTLLPLLVTGCCPPLNWLAAFFLGQAPYLVIVRDYGVVDALKESFERSKRHWHVLVMAIVFMIAISAIAALVAIPFALLSFAGGIIHTAIGTFFWSFPYMVLMFFTMVGSFIISATAFASIDELEGLGTIDPDLE